MPRRKPKTIRLVAWNCNQAFHRKWEYLVQQLNPDIAIISECADLEQLARNDVPIRPETSLWIGENKHRGLGVFTFGEYRLAPIASKGPGLKWILPASIHGPLQFDLIAVWARYHEAKRTGAPGPVLDAIEALPRLLRNKRTVLAGDFNSSVAFKSTRHQTIVSQLQAMGLESAYHHYFGVRQGKETHPTIYWRDRKKNSKFNYHIDYCFLPTQWCSMIRDLSVGSYEHWIRTTKSDHVPLLVELDLA